MPSVIGSRCSRWVSRSGILGGPCRSRLGCTPKFTMWYWLPFLFHPSLLVSILLPLLGSVSVSVRISGRVSKSIVPPFHISLSTPIVAIFRSLSLPVTIPSRLLFSLPIPVFLPFSFPVSVSVPILPGQRWILCGGYPYLWDRSWLRSMPGSRIGIRTGSFSEFIRTRNPLMRRLRGWC